MRLKKGDTVVIITGKDRSKSGKILRVLKKHDRVVVEGLNKVTRHIKKTKARPGEKVVFEAPLHISNVMLVDPKTKKPSRVAYHRSKEGKKDRIAKKSNTIL